MARPRWRCLHRQEMLLCSCCNRRAPARYECGLAQHSKADKLAALPQRHTSFFVPVRAPLVRPPGRTGRGARRAERSVRVCIQNSAPDQTGLGSFIEQRSAASVAPQPPKQSYQVVSPRGAAIGQLGQLHCGHTSRQACLGSARCRSDRTRSCARAGQLSCRLTNAHLRNYWAPVPYSPHVSCAAT